MLLKCYRNRKKRGQGEGEICKLYISEIKVFISYYVVTVYMPRKNRLTHKIVFLSEFIFLFSLLMDKYIFCFFRHLVVFYPCIALIWFNFIDKRWCWRKVILWFFTLCAFMHFHIKGLICWSQMMNEWIFYVESIWKFSESFFLSQNLYFLENSALFTFLDICKSPYRWKLRLRKHLCMK